MTEETDSPTQRISSEPTQHRLIHVSIHEDFKKILDDDDFREPPALLRGHEAPQRRPGAGAVLPVRALHAGQPAELKVEAFSYTRYGLLHGEVRSVSRDALRSEHDAPNPERDQPSAKPSQRDAQNGMCT